MKPLFELKDRSNDIRVGSDFKPKTAPRPHFLTKMTSFLLGVSSSISWHAISPTNRASVLLLGNMDDLPNSNETMSRILTLCGMLFGCAVNLGLNKKVYPDIVVHSANLVPAISLVCAMLALWIDWIDPMQYLILHSVSAFLSMYYPLVNTVFLHLHDFMMVETYEDYFAGQAFPLILIAVFDFLVLKLGLAGSRIALTLNFALFLAFYMVSYFFQLIIIMQSRFKNTVKKMKEMINDDQISPDNIGSYLIIKSCQSQLVTISVNALITSIVFPMVTIQIKSISFPNTLWSILYFDNLCFFLTFGVFSLIGCYGKSDFLKIRKDPSNNYILLAMRLLLVSLLLICYRPMAKDYLLPFMLKHDLIPPVVAAIFAWMHGQVTVSAFRECKEKYGMLLRRQLLCYCVLAHGIGEFLGGLMSLPLV